MVEVVWTCRLSIPSLSLFLVIGARNPCCALNVNLNVNVCTLIFITSRILVMRINILHAWRPFWRDCDMSNLSFRSHCLFFHDVRRINDIDNAVRTQWHCRYVTNGLAKTNGDSVSVRLPWRDDPLSFSQTATRVRLQEDCARTDR